MRSILLSGGLAQLRQQNQSNVDFIRVTGFSVGTRQVSQSLIEDWDEAEPAGGINEMTGATVFRGDASSINWTPTQDQGNEALLVLRIPESVAQIDFSNVILYSTFAGSEDPFVFFAADVDFIKLQTTSDSAGYGWWFHAMLEIPNLDHRLKFDNLVSRTASFLSCSTDQTVPIPFTEGHDQIFIHEHTLTRAPTTGYNIGNTFWGLPWATTFDKANIFSAGRSGDNNAGDRLKPDATTLQISTATGLKFSLYAATEVIDWTASTYTLQVSDGVRVMHTATSANGELYVPDSNQRVLACYVELADFVPVLPWYRFSLTNAAGVTLLAGNIDVEDLQ